MRSGYGSGVWSLALAVVLVGCFEGVEEVVIARIDGEPVSYLEFEAYVEESVGESPTVLDDQVLGRLFQELIDEHCLRRLAASRGLVADSAGRRQAVEALERSLSFAEMTADDVERHYARHAEEFVRTERIVLGQILVQDRALADEILRRIQEGAEFSEVVEQVEPGGAVFGGYQSELAESDLPETFAAVIFALEEGEVSGVVSADYGFHIFHVLERLPEETVPLERARPLIEAKLRDLEASTRLRAMVQEARSLYNVELLPQNLPFALDSLEEP